MSSACPRAASTDTGLSSPAGTREDAARSTTPFPTDVTVGIIAHNARHSLPTAIRSALGAGCPPDRIIVADIASNDGTADYVRAQHPEVQLMRLPQNRGPNPGRNASLRYARTRFVLLMDADVELEPETATLLRQAFDQHPDLALAAPLVVYATQPNVIQYGGTAFHVLCEAVNRWQGQTVAARGDDWAEVNAVSGNAMLIDRHAAAEVGLFDEALFLGKEDSELAYRLALHGYRLLEVPRARARHAARGRGTELFVYQIRNRWYFILKNYQARTILVLLPVLAIHELLQFALLVARGHGGRYLRAVAALIQLAPTLPSERRRVQSRRCVPDRELLTTGPLVVRGDLLRHPFLRRAKTTYEALVSRYWRLVYPILPGRCGPRVS